jgi:4-hydroxyphenylpyruvate dioxygenase
MVRDIDVKKIIYVQVVDAAYLEEPLLKGHRFYNSSQRPRMSWSRNCRLFYGEQDRGGYLPIKDILQAIIERLGYNGWISAELFNESLTVANSSVPEQHARRAAESWQKIVKDLNIEVEEPKSLRRTTTDGHRAQL